MPAFPIVMQGEAILKSSRKQGLSPRAVRVAWLP